MGDKKTFWLVGCGIGCGSVLLVVVVLVAWTGMFMRNTMKGFKESVESSKELERRYGAVDDFVPWPDGAIPRERIEAFLAVRGATAAARQQLSRSFRAIPLDEEDAKDLDSKPFSEKMGKVFEISGAAFGLAGGIGRFLDQRNRALLESEMGLGEYTYLYAVVYYSWLGHGPRSGPGDDDGGDGDRSLGDDMFPERVYGELAVLLRNQRDAAVATPPDPAWAAALEAEVERLDAADGRIPWEDGLPAVIAASLDPFRERLEAHFDPAVNPLELARNEQRGSFSFTVD